MHFTILILFAVASLIAAVAEKMGKCPVGVASILLSVFALIVAAVPIK